ncbi:DNRLRE domain-containing protein [Ureibacillus manganicus]|uniref:Wall-associated protein n=1 Tax=Ureibacillus manganicus DSM 26584 TaxID=1384049 RepID=A0A0A3I7R5_9BACL|nr:DNRLRE domain-containing protein [Ureibacillus manganicus]KGR79565.1 hypothetical protein CD29_05555 [Ureibacillus manganicus DSM 26584]
MIDPTIVRVQGTDLTTDTILRSGFPTQSGGNDTEIGAGRANDNIVRSLLRFDLSSVATVSEILSADLNLYLSSTNSTSPIDISVHYVNNAWNENEATWQNRTNTLKWSTAGADYGIYGEATVKNISTIPSNIEDALVKWPIPIDKVYGWVWTPNINHGILIRSAMESSKVYKKFYSSENTVDSKYKPKLVVTYKTSARFGLEDYWDYNSFPLIDGTNYINIGTQNNILQYTDFSLSNYAGFGLDFTRTYNSKALENSAFGHSWTFTGNQKLFIGTGNSKTNIDYQDEDGTVHVFTWNGSNYVKPVGFKGELTKVSDSEYTIKQNNIVSTFIVKEQANDTSVKVAYITKQEDKNKNSITYEYNSDNQLVKITTGLGDFLTLSYRNGVIVKAVSKGKEITYNYNGKHYITSVVVKKDASQQTTTSFNYTNDRITSIIDANGNVTSFAYGSIGLSSVTLPSVGGNTPSTTYYDLDNVNLKATVTSPEGEETVYYLNNNYVITKIIDSSGTQRNYTLDNQYKISEEQVTVPGETPYTKKYAYDTKGNLEKVEDSKGIVSKYTYDTAGNLLTETDSSGYVTQNQYDAKGNLIKIITPKGEVTTYIYDARGDLTKVTYPSGSSDTFSTNYTDGKKTTVHTDPATGKSTESIYDFNDNLLSFKDGKGYTTIYKYNLKNELTSVTDATGKTTNYQYDGNGNLTVIQNVAGHQTVLAYNGQNNISKETNALGKVTEYQYDGDGNLINVIKANGSKINYNQDSQTQSSIVSINNTNQFTTKSDGLATTITNHMLNNSSTTYISSEDGRLKQVDFSSPANNAIVYMYNNELLDTIQFSGNTIKYTPDANGQIEAISQNGINLATFGFNNNGLLENTTFGNSNSIFINNNYVGNNTLLKSQIFNTTISTIWDTHTYDYDANKQISKVINNAGNVVYTYDNLNQLEKEQYSNGLTISYTYDTVGNRISKSVTNNGNTTTTIYSYNAANQLTKAGDQSFSVDLNGNTTNDGRYEYVWNAFDQLTEVKSLSGTTIAKYNYDENGRRVYSKDVNGETYYRYDGTSNYVLFEEDQAGNITKSYTYNASGHPLTMTYNAATYYYLTNYRGDVLALTDENGQIVAEYTYDAWGNILTQSGEMASTNPYRYAGYRYDEQTKLYYLMARYYNPDTGVFMSLDPVRGDTMNPITMNGYNYANNNPVMNVDPDGERSLWASFKYGFLKALEIFIGKWGISRELGETIVSLTANFILGSVAFVNMAKIKQTNFTAYLSYIKKVAGKFTGTLKKTAKNQLIKRLGKTAALKILGGVAGVGFSEGIVFTFNLIYYTVNHYRKS